MTTQRAGEYTSLEPRRRSISMNKLNDSDSEQHLMLEAQETSYSRAATPSPEESKPYDGDEDVPVCSNVLTRRVRLSLVPS
jgi:hypothetical protein